jgi:hypothetical protein
VEKVECFVIQKKGNNPSLTTARVVQDALR